MQNNKYSSRIQEYKFKLNSSKLMEQIKLYTYKYQIVPLKMGQNRFESTYTRSAVCKVNADQQQHETISFEPCKGQV